MAVVLLSGGLDSTVCLHWAMQQWGRENVQALTVDYGQRHLVELQAAARIARRAGVEHVVAQLGAKGIGLPSALTSTGPFSGSPVVPGRNLYLLTMAAAMTQQKGGGRVIIGCSAADREVFPDCRATFLERAAAALSAALDYAILIQAPLLILDKPGTLKLAHSLGPDCWNALELTWTCYDPQPAGQNKWHVRRCGVCMACEQRAAGFAAAGLEDPAPDEVRA